MGYGSAMSSLMEELEGPQVSGIQGVRDQLIGPVEIARFDQITSYFNNLGLNDEEQVYIMAAGGLAKLSLAKNIGKAVLAYPSLARFTPTQVGMALTFAFAVGSGLNVLDSNDPDSEQYRNNRLLAAEQDTGFKLDDEVEVSGAFGSTGAKGRVVGFARVENAERRVVIRLIQRSFSKDGNVPIDLIAVKPEYVQLRT